MKELVRYFTLLSLLSLIKVVSAQNFEIPPEITHSLPPVEDGPVPVYVGVYVIDTLSIDDVQQTTVLDLVQTIEWKDSRLAQEALGFNLEIQPVDLEQIWDPNVNLLNTRSIENTTRRVSVDSEGNVLVWDRMTVAVTELFDLRRFPFDKQAIKLEYYTLYDPSEVVLQINQEKLGNLKEFSVAGWSYLKTETNTTSRNLESVNRVIGGLEINLIFERHSGFYLWKVFIPLGFIVFMAWTVFWIDPAEFGTQIGISTSSVITLVAFQLGLVSLLPPIAYTTEVDIYILGCSCLIFLALGEAIITARLARNKKHKLSLAIDRAMRWIYPVVFLILFLFVRF